MSINQQTSQAISKFQLDSLFFIINLIVRLIQLPNVTGFLAYRSYDLVQSLHAIDQSSGSQTKGRCTLFRQ